MAELDAPEVLAAAIGDLAEFNSLGPWRTCAELLIDALADAGFVLAGRPPDPGEEGEFSIEARPGAKGVEQTVCVHVAETGVMDDGNRPPSLAVLCGWGYADFTMCLSPEQMEELAAAGLEVVRQIRHATYAWEAEHG